MKTYNIEEDRIVDHTSSTECHKFAGIAYSPDIQYGMQYNSRKTDEQRFAAAWHSAHCRIGDCEYCNFLSNSGLIICCDDCGHVHHTDWLGWSGEVDENGHCKVYCPECKN